MRLAAGPLADPRFAKAAADLVLAYVDTDRHPETVGRHRIVDLPTLIFFSPEGGTVGRLENEFRDASVDRIVAGVAAARKKWAEFRSAEAKWKRKMALAPADPEPPLRLGRLYYSVRLYDKAQPPLDRAIRLDPDGRGPDAPLALLLATYCNVRTERYAEARVQAQDFLARHPDHAEAARQRYYLGVAFFHLGKRDEADAVWRDVIARHPGTPWERQARESLELPPRSD